MAPWNGPNKTRNFRQLSSGEIVFDVYATQRDLLSVECRRRSGSFETSGHWSKQYSLSQSAEIGRETSALGGRQFGT